MIFDAVAKKRLWAEAHRLKPVVTIGQHGYSTAIAVAIDEALADHELIKVRLRGVERDRRRPVIEEICRDLGAEFVGLIGAVATLFRPRPEKDD